MAVHARMGLAAPQPIEARARPRLVTGAIGLAAHGLGKQFRGRPVLRGVSVQVRRGEAVGLLGPNGAGKTTCFHIITGLLQADYGTVSLDDDDITDLPMHRRARLGVGYLRRSSVLPLPGGEGRRVETARALASHPGFILLEEPLAGIDPINIAEI